MLDKLDSCRLFLPELQVAVHRCCDDKVGSVGLLGEGGYYRLESLAYLVTVTKLTTSLCIKLLWYRSALGK